MQLLTDLELFPTAMALVVPVVNEMHWGILMLLPIVLALPALEREQEKERQTVKKESFCVVQLSQSHQPEKINHLGHALYNM